MPIIAIYTILISITVFASDEDFYGTYLREKELDEKLIDANFYKKCKDQAQTKSSTKYDANNISEREQEFRDCVDKALKEIDDKDIKDLAVKTNLNSITKEQSKSAKGIREYFSERLAKLLLGKDYDPMKTLQKKKYVDQELFFSLYAEQLGKNSLLEVSNYCLENLRDVEQLAKSDMKEKLNASANCLQEMSSEDKVISKKCLNNLYEIDFPLSAANAKDVIGDIQSLKSASSEEIQKSTPQDLKNKSGFCALIVNPMCNRYKCQDQSFRDIPENKELCDKLGVTRPSNNSLFVKENENGAKACVVVDKMRKYKLAIENVKKIQEEFKKASNSGKTGYATNLFNNFYDGAFDSRDGSFTEITTIGSKEITEDSKIEGFYLSKEEAEKLKKKCLSSPNDPECKNLYDENLDEKNATLEAAFKTETDLKIKNLKNLKGKDDIKKYLETIGLSSLYDEKLDVDKLKELIEAHYKNEREALIVNMRSKLKNKLKVKTEKGDLDQLKVTEIIDDSIKNLEEEKDRLGTIIHYNNIITSFIQIKDKEEISQNTAGLKAEMEDFEKYKDNTSGSGEDYFKNIEDVANQKKTDGSGAEYLDYIDAVLGIKKDDKKTK